jgi:copper resistance protein D
MTTTWFVLTRAVHFGACLLFFGVFAFDRFVAVVSRDETETANYWQSRVQRFCALTLPIILLSGIAWFVLVAVTMSGLSFGQAAHLETLKAVWTQTEFGTVWKWRGFFWFAATVGALFLWFSKPRFSLSRGLIWIELLLGGLLLGSLAWGGHGQEDSSWHLLADVLHLLVAGFWPTGLLPLILLLRRLRQGSEAGRAHSVATLVRRFSAVNLGSVALLSLTGWVNARFLVGSFSNLFEQPYGRWLLVKIILFGIAVAIGAVNLLRLKSRLAVDKFQRQTVEAAAAQLQFNVQMELILGSAIVVVVAILGILPPAIH